MKLGHSTKTDASKLGVFGVGLKLSSLASEANEVTIHLEQTEMQRHFDVYRPPMC